jgi:hypothetical protein
MNSNAAHRTPHTTQSRTPQFTLIKVALCECVCIYMNLRELTWIYVNLREFIWIHLNQKRIMWMCANLREYWQDFILNHLIYSEFIRIYTNMLWIYLKICTLPNCRTQPHCRTTAHCRAHCRTAAHCCAHSHTAGHRRALCCTLPHTAWIRMPDSRTPHTAHRSQSHTAINMN